MRSSDTDADQGKGRSSKTPNLGTWVQSMRARVLRCTSVCAHALEGPAWMQQFGFMARRASFLLSSSLSSPSWVSQLSPCLSISCLGVSASPWQPVLGVC